MIRFLTKLFGVFILKIVYAKSPEKYEKAGTGIVSGVSALAAFWMLCILFSLVFHSSFCIIMAIFIPVVIFIWAAIEWSESSQKKQI